MGEKQWYGHFKRQTREISHKKTWTWLKKGKIKERNWSLQIAAQNNAMRTNYIYTIDKTQQKSRCILCGDRDETINHIISECSKLVQRKYKTRNDWVGKVIHREFCKKFKFSPTNTWYLDNLEKSPWKWDAQTTLGFWDTKGSHNHCQTTRYSDKKEKEPVDK